MLTFKNAERLFRVRPNGRVRLKDHDPGWAGGSEFKELKNDELKARAKSFLQKNLEALAEAQERLYANDIYSVLIVLQAMDAAGKDGTIKHVMSGVNPQGCQVFCFKKPSAEELDHDFLWRYMRALPERGRIGIFNRSYYEDVLVVRVHPEILDAQQAAAGKTGKGFWEARYDDINRFEQHLERNGTLILNFSATFPRRQKHRFLERSTTLTRTGSSRCGSERTGLLGQLPGGVSGHVRTRARTGRRGVIPADHKWVTRALVSAVIARRIEDLGLKRPVISAAQQRTRPAPGASRAATAIGRSDASWGTGGKLGNWEPGELGSWGTGELES